MAKHDYISREAAKAILHKRAMETALNNVGYQCDAGVVFQDASHRLKVWLDDVPTADVRPVRGGQWIKICERDEAFDLAGFYTWMSKYQCNQCGFIQSCIEDKGRYVFCPCCGSDMRPREECNNG